jgi:hypothetical protein
MMAKILVESVQEDLDANCIRKDPLQASEVVKRVNKGDVLKIAAVKTSVADTWYPVKLSDKGDYGWIHRDAVDPAGDGSQCSVRGPSMKPTNIRDTLQRVKKLAPEWASAADQVDAELWIRDAEQKQGDGRYAAAYASYQKARELNPNDARLSASIKCWIFANGFLLLIFIGVLVVTVIALFFVLKNRQKRVKVAEFKYYGKDRVRVEREIDGGAAPAEGAPAPSEQPPAAPPAA